MATISPTTDEFSQIKTSAPSPPSSKVMPPDYVPFPGPPVALTWRWKAFRPEGLRTVNVELWENKTSDSPETARLISKCDWGTYRTTIEPVHHTYQRLDFCSINPQWPSPACAASRSKRRAWRGSVEKARGRATLPPFCRGRPSKATPGK